MRAGVIIDGVEQVDKGEFLATPQPGDIVEYEGGEAVVKRLRHNLTNRLAYVVCETDRAVLAVSVPAVEVPKPMAKQLNHAVDAVDEAQSSPKPPQQPRKRGRNR